MKLAKFEKEDIKIRTFLKSKKSICAVCGRKYHKIGWTTLLGMRTGVIFGCCKGHKKDPRVLGVPLEGKSKYFNGVLFGF